MGRDKALLPFRGRTLVVHMAGIVKEALGNGGEVAIVGDPVRYADLDYPVHADRVPSRGPLSGIITALRLSKTDWNLVVACDMPSLAASNLRILLERPRESQAQCVAARSPSGELEPLCAVYHRGCLSVLEQAFRSKRLKMRDLLSELRTDSVAFPAAALANANTPEEWSAVQPDPK